MKNTLLRLNLRYLDQFNHFNYEVNKALTLEIMHIYLARIKKVVQLNESCDLRDTVN